MGQAAISDGFAVAPPTHIPRRSQQQQVAAGRRHQLRPHLSSLNLPPYRTTPLSSHITWTTCKIPVAPRTTRPSMAPSTHPSPCSVAWILATATQTKPTLLWWWRILSAFSRTAWRIASTPVQIPGISWINGIQIRETGTFRFARGLPGGTIWPRATAP